MITAERAIRVANRDLAIGTAVKLATGFVIAIVFVAVSAVGSGAAGLLVMGGVFVALMAVSAKLNQGSVAVAQSKSLMEAGQYDEAEQQIEQVLGTVWSLRAAKLLGLHQLAVLRHAQRRFGESALLAGAFLRLGRPGLLGRLVADRSRNRTLLPIQLAHTARLMLADSAVELNDLPAAHAALAELYAERLSLNDAMELLVVQLEYEARLAAWPAMLANVGHKVQLAELLPAGPSARAQALLALAAMKSDRADLADWLRRRVDLLVDVDELVAQRPVLAEVFAGAADQGDVPAEPGAVVGGTEVSV